MGYIFLKHCTIIFEAEQTVVEANHLLVTHDYNRGGLITIGGDWLHCNLHPRLPPKTTSMIRSHDNIHNHLPIAHDNIHDSLLDEVHLWPNCSLFDDDISCNTDVNNKRLKFPMILVYFLKTTTHWFILETWLKNFVLKLCDNFGDERGVGICEERHRGNQSPTVVVDHILTQLLRELPENQFFVEEFTLIPVLKIPGKVAELRIKYCSWKLLSDLVSCVSRQFPVGHVLLNLLHFLSRKKNMFTLRLS